MYLSTSTPSRGARLHRGSKVVRKEAGRRRGRKREGKVGMLREPVHHTGSDHESYSNNKYHKPGQRFARVGGGKIVVFALMLFALSVLSIAYRSSKPGPVGISNNENIARYATTRARTSQPVAESEPAGFYGLHAEDITGNEHARVLCRTMCVVGNLEAASNKRTSVAHFSVNAKYCVCDEDLPGHQNRKRQGHCYVPVQGQGAVHHQRGDFLRQDHQRV